MTVPLDTPKAWQDYLVRLGMEAWDNVTAAGRTMGGRFAIETALRERMAQAAQVIACELETADAAHTARVYEDAARCAESSAAYYQETPMLSHDERAARDRLLALAATLRARGRL